MRVSPLLVPALCAACLTGACDLGTAPSTPVAQQVTVSGYLGKGIFSDSVATGAPFQLVASDSSGQAGGELVMLGDVAPPAGRYDLDTGQLPTGLSSLSVQFVHPTSSGTLELYSPAGGNMVITSIAGDSIAGTLAFSMLLTGTCVRAQGSLQCQGLAVAANRVLSLSGGFVARRAAGATFPGA